MRQRDGRKRLFKTFTACLLALAMLLSNMGATSVWAEGTVPAPTIGDVFIGSNTISGGNVHRDRVDGKTVRATVHVTLKDKNGTEKAKVSVTPKRGTTWTVNLPEGVKVAEGDTVTAYQELNGNRSLETSPKESKESMLNKNKDKLTMPEGEIWIEQTNSNLINEDERAEAVKMFNDANTEIAGDIKSVKFSIDGTDHAYFEVTYTDGSKTDKIEAPNLKIKTVTETSAAPTIEKVQVTDGQIIVTFEKEVAAGTKFYFIKEFTDGEDKGFCQNGNCTPDKTKTQEMSQAVSVDGKKVTFPVKDDDLELKRTFGIIIKEPHKFRSCAKSVPVVTTPDKVAVRDPKKLTDDDKKAIDKAIRDANTINGVSKLPDGTGDKKGTPAFIEFDKDGKIKIISPNDVEATWDSNYNPVYVKNDDGSYKLKDGAKPITIPAKDLVKNIAPDAPAVNLTDDEKKVTVTTDPKDTDAKTIKVSYTDPDGNEKTVEATKDDKGNWTAPKGFDISVDSKTGAVRLNFPASMAKGGSTVKATVTDNGGLVDEEKPLESDKAELVLDCTVSFDANGGSGTMDSVKVKKGDKFKLPENKFTPPAGKEFKGWEVDSKEYAPGDEITVEGNVIVKAIWEGAAVPKPEGPTDDRPLYKGSILILPGGEAKAEEPAMEIGRHIRYLYGYEDRTVRPEGKITRAEAAALIARLAELDMSDKSKPDFADTPSSWYNSAINIMVKKDLMFGDKNGNFRPNEAITRGEFARALLYIDKKNDKVAPFADVKGHEFEAAINQAFGNGRINGYPDGTFRPDDYIQRAEAARILNQYANRGTTLEGMAPVAKDLIQFTDINPNHWAYCEVMEAANSHEYQRAKGTQAETWLKILYDEMKK